MQIWMDDVQPPTDSNSNRSKGTPLDVLPWIRDREAPVSNPGPPTLTQF